MTEKDIVKALACYSGDETLCSGCGYKGEWSCRKAMAKDALNLINRQKAEIEKLKANNKKMFDKWEILDNTTKQYYADLYADSIEAERAEAIKEFADKLLERLDIEALTEFEMYDGYDIQNTKCIVNTLVKEITEGDNNA